MATRNTPPPIQLKQFGTAEEIDRAITKLGRRLEEIKKLDANRIRYDDQEVFNIEHRVRDTFLEVFGISSPEYLRHARFEIQPGRWSPNMTEIETQREFASALVRAASLLDGVIKNLEEKRADLGHDSSNRIHAAFNGLDLHPRIAGVSAELFQGRHYRNAVLDASIALVNVVKEKSRRHDLDGADLMRTVFSRKNPILVFNELKDQSELDEQEGLMHLFEGAALALRNPRAHELTPDSPEEALEYIGLLSFLAKQVDRAKKRKDE